MAVIYNSLNHPDMQQIFAQVRDVPRVELKRKYGIAAQSPVLVCLARLIPWCRFDLLIEAVALLDGEIENNCTILLIGDGPEREPLEVLANKLGVKLELPGSCYDEMTLAEYYHMSDVCVSPGKIGLTAIHSLSYGTPVITHNDHMNQGPEFEAIQPGVCGDFFNSGDKVDLAKKIKNWLGKKDSAEDVIDNCIDSITQNFTPIAQREAIDQFIDELLPAQ